MSIEQILALMEAEQFACTLKNIENENGMNGRTLKLIGENRKLATSMLVSSDSQPESVFTKNSINSYDEDIEDDSNGNDLGNKNSG